MGTRRYLSTLPMMALLFLTLGIGNLWVGRSKAAYYKTAIDRLTTNANETASADSLAVQRLQSRLEFYSIVSIGGLGFLTLAACLLIIDRAKRSR
jgi:hypothetical protein